MSIADKLTVIAGNVQKVYDAGYDAGKAEGGGTVIGLPTYETDVTFVSTTSSVVLTHNLNTQKFLVIGRVKEHDGTDLNTYRLSQVVAWSPDAYFQDAEYKLANGGTYNPFEYYVEGDVATGAYVFSVGSGNATATTPSSNVATLKASYVMQENTGNSFRLHPNNYFLINATWHFTVVDVSSIM